MIGTPEAACKPPGRRGGRKLRAACAARVPPGRPCCGRPACTGARAYCWHLRDSRSAASARDRSASAEDAVREQSRVERVYPGRGRPPGVAGRGRHGPPRRSTGRARRGSTATGTAPGTCQKPVHRTIGAPPGDNGSSASATGFLLYLGSGHILIHIQAAAFPRRAWSHTAHSWPWWPAEYVRPATSVGHIRRCR